MRRRRLIRLAALLGAISGPGCAPPGLKPGSEAILSSPHFPAIGVGDGLHARVDLPPGTRVRILETDVKAIPGLGQLPYDFPPMARISVEDGEHVGLVGFVEQGDLQPIP